MERLIESDCESHVSQLNSQEKGKGKEKEILPLKENSNDNELYKFESSYASSSASFDAATGIPNPSSWAPPTPPPVFATSPAPSPAPASQPCSPTTPSTQAPRKKRSPLTDDQRRAGKELQYLMKDQYAYEIDKVKKHSIDMARDFDRKTSCFKKIEKAFYHLEEEFEKIIEAQSIKLEQRGNETVDYRAYLERLHKEYVIEHWFSEQKRIFDEIKKIAKQLKDKDN